MSSMALCFCQVFYHHIIQKTNKTKKNPLFLHTSLFEDGTQNDTATKARHLFAFFWKNIFQFLSNFRSDMQVVVWPVVWLFSNYTSVTENNFTWNLQFQTPLRCLVAASCNSASVSQKQRGSWQSAPTLPSNRRKGLRLNLDSQYKIYFSWQYKLKSIAGDMFLVRTQR